MSATLALWPDQRTRALQHAQTPGAVRIESNGTRADVASFSGNGRHTVARAGSAWLCDCDFYTLTGLQCAHSVAARLTLTTGAPDVQAEGKSAQAQYDAAVTREVHLFDALLADLCAGIPEPPYAGTGRPTVPLREQAFCAVQKVYSQLSCRRAKALFDKAADRGEIHRAPAFAFASRFLNRSDAEAILTDLIHRSAAPLANLEVDFAVDSTGFRTTTFTPYLQDKHRDGKKHEYLKAHAICGVRTNIITSILVTASTGEGTADSPNFPPLVEATARTFQVREVSADKAYAGKKNHWIVKQAGGEALIPFKDGKARSTRYTGNASGLPGSGGLWRKAQLYFEAHREEFDERYHKRSNVEATFSAVKRKFGDALKSRKEQAQRNEVLAKALAYNLTVLIKASVTLGIDLQVCLNPHRVEV